jgi:hypothetical protein
MEPKGLRCYSLLAPGPWRIRVESEVGNGITFSLYLPYNQCDPATRHIPVHVISSQELGDKALRHSARSYLKKSLGNAQLQKEFVRIHDFAESYQRTLLVVQSDATQRDAISKPIGGDNSRKMAARGITHPREKTWP